MRDLKKRILVVDDEASMREFLGIMLRREGYAVDLAEDGVQAQEALSHGEFELVISDVRMPRLGGLDLLAHVKKVAPETIVLMMTAFSSTAEAVEAMKNGAYDYITKPFRNEEVRLIIQNALERKALRQENRVLKDALKKRYTFSGLVGKSHKMRQLYDLIEKVAASNVSVLVSGESGTGKEVVAKAIHHNCERKGAPFIPVNCGAIPENLLESELFGHEKGAFTGAIQQKQGLFEIAKGGTLFLDEIGELPAMMQVKLLRVLQEREMRRVGGTRDIPVDVRIVAATNKDLQVEVETGTFREDLYYRLNVINLTLPPLRERREDIPLLLDFFWQKKTGVEKVTVAPSTMRRLLDYPWPGNIRELVNVVERCVVLGAKGNLDDSALPPAFFVSSIVSAPLVDLPENGLDLDAYLGGIEKDILLKALERCGGVRKRAAELLNISFRSIRYRLAKFGLEPEGEGGEKGEG
ncbi:MAG: Fis family transcriptional regulator [Desulfuromonas sp.]|nr:MAG: Fis family transcriptional regulator [Desulfuromonas sp.]